MFQLFLAGSLLVFAFLACVSDPDSLRIGIEGGYPPFNFMNESGEVDGFERELGEELCRRIELECVWVINEWDSIVFNLLLGDYDAIMAGMSITAERDEVIDFTQPYYPPLPSAYIALAGVGETAITGRVVNLLLREGGKIVSTQHRVNHQRGGNDRLV